MLTARRQWILYSRNVYGNGVKEDFMRPKNEVKKISSATRSDVHTGAGSLDEYIFSRKSGTGKIRDHKSS